MLTIKLFSVPLHFRTTVDNTLHVCDRNSIRNAVTNSISCENRHVDQVYLSQASSDLHQTSMKQNNMLNNVITTSGPLNLPLLFLLLLPCHHLKEGECIVLIIEWNNSNGNNTDHCDSISMVLMRHTAMSRNVF